MNRRELAGLAPLLDKWNARQDLARDSYHQTAHCRLCGAPTAVNANRQPVRCDDCRKEATP